MGDRCSCGAWVGLRDRHACPGPRWIPDARISGYDPDRLRVVGLKPDVEALMLEIALLRAVGAAALEHVMAPFTGHVRTRDALRDATAAWRANAPAQQPTNEAKGEAVSNAKEEGTNAE